MTNKDTQALLERLFELEDERDALTEALRTTHNERAALLRERDAMAEALRGLNGIRIDAALALANWQKYNDRQSDEVVYQAEKMASVLANLGRALTANKPLMDGGKA